MKKLFFPLMILIAGLILVSCSKHDYDDTYGKIKEFAVTDYPFDDGTGISLSWTPLSKDHRIIEYRIYRGHTPDSLFMVSKIEVDPKLGVISDKLHYHDKDFQVLYDLETAPGKLKKEKHQKPNSPIYRAIPRDISVLEKVVPHYQVAGVINPHSYYTKGKKVKNSEEEDALAGYKLHRFTSLYANPMADNEYFYTVLAVNEQGRVLPYADIKSAIPVNNRPDTTAVLYPVYLSDTNDMSFEFTAPASSQDIGSWHAWLLPDAELPRFYAEQLKNAEARLEGNNDAWQANAILLCEVPGTNPYHKISMADLDLAGLSLEDLANYQIVCGVTDGKGLSAYGLSKKLKINTTADLPTIPAFTVQDKANDKGDYNLVSISNPIAFVVLANYSDDSHKKIQLNYEVSENDLYKLDRLEIDISSPTNGKIASVTEYYIDKSIIFSLPEKHLKDNEFDLRITPIVLGKKGYTKYEPITQKIIYDAKNHRFDALDVYLKGQNLSTLYYDIATKTKLDDQHYPGNRINAINRAYDHLVSYETDMFMLVYGIDPKTKQLLLDPSIIVSVDSETGVPFQASLFRDEFEASIKEMHSKKASLEAQLKSSPASDSIAQELDMLSAQLASIEGNPAYKKAKTQKSDKKWLKTLMRAKDANSRSVSYQMIVTDGKGLHSFSEPFKGAKDQEYFYPVANWYNTKETSTLIGTLLFAVVIALTLFFVKRGKGMYIRPIAGLEELDNAVGRATEMGRPIMFVPGWGTLGDVCTISSMMILNQVAKKTAEYDTRLISPHADYFVVSLAQEMVRNAYSEVGRPDAFNQDDIFFVSDSQFAFSASVNGLTIRERVATIFYMGFFNAEVLIMTETGNQSGAIQIAGTDAITQVPFFITSCDYTLIGEEFYAASAYLSRDVELVSMLKASDYFKLMIIFFAVVGTILTTLRLNHILYLFPIE